MSKLNKSRKIEPLRKKKKGNARNQTHCKINKSYLWFTNRLDMAEERIHELEGR